ncbi:MAG: hypothetical protein ACOX2U_02560 [Limisphaerales bacterium]|jgi:hypothetical protein
MIRSIIFILCLVAGFIAIIVIPGIIILDFKVEGPTLNSQTDQSLQEMEMQLGISFPTNTTIIFAGRPGPRPRADRSVIRSAGPEWSLFSESRIRLPFEDSSNSFLDIIAFVKEEEEIDPDTNVKQFIRRYVERCEKDMNQKISGGLENIEVYDLKWVKGGIAYMGSLICTKNGDYFYARTNLVADLNNVRSGVNLDKKSPEKEPIFWSE